MTSLLSVLLVAGATSGDGDAPRSNDPRMLDCAPSVLRAWQPLVISMGPGHGSELTVRRASGNTGDVLVAHAPPDGEPQLMTPDAFARVGRAELPTSRRGRASVDAPLAPIFSSPGTSEVHVSDTLESDARGSVRSFEYIGALSGEPSVPKPADTQA